MVTTKKISFQTKGHCDIIDITPQVQQQLAESDISEGTVTLFISGSTAGISTIEFESGLLSDFQSMWERNIPTDIPYQHDRAWGEGNGYSHVRASALGTWQQIVLVDFDNRPRSRQIVVQIMGE